MAAPQAATDPGTGTTTDPATGTAPLPAVGVRLSAVVHQEFPERGEPVIGWPEPIARQVMAAYGREADLSDYLGRSGNSFITMSEALLARLPGPLPAMDTVLLAYRTPDLYNSDVAGCYLSQRLPAAPPPCSIAGQGTGAAFTALRVAAGMREFGELSQGAVFAYEQHSTVWDADPAEPDRTDEAVLLRLDTAGEVVVVELGEVRAGGPGHLSPAAALAAATARHPGVPVVIGAALAAEPGVEPGEFGPGGAEVAGSGTSCTGVWAALARRWPLREPLLLADHHAAGHRFHSCLLVPEATP
jgi:hypothetical protein